MSVLKLALDGKTKFHPTHRNTFGLMYGLPQDGGTCPGATTGSGGCLNVRTGKKRCTCYMAKITQIYRPVGATLKHNTDLINNTPPNELVEKVLKPTVQEFKNKCKGKPFFRLHYSGDFINTTYGEAWKQTCLGFPDVNFWVYTRTPGIAPLFIDVPNISVFYSTDAANYENMAAEYEQYSSYPNIGICYMGDATPDDRKWTACPGVTHKIKSTAEMGACAQCRLCLGKPNQKLHAVQFPIH